MTITKEELEKRHGVNVGFFYLREKGAASARKVWVFVKVSIVRRSSSRFDRQAIEQLGFYHKEAECRVWDGARWRQYDEFEPDAVLDRAIERCREFNGDLGR